MRLQNVIGAVLLLGTGCGTVEDTNHAGTEAQAQVRPNPSTSCRRTQPTATGSFVAPDSEPGSPTSDSQNPIVAVTAAGNTLTFTSWRGETGTITLLGATAEGGFRDRYGLYSAWLAPFQGARLNAPVPTMQLRGGEGKNHPIRFVGAEVATLSGGFGFYDVLGNTLSVVAVKASGDTIAFSDAWGQTATITLSGVCEN